MVDKNSTGYSRNFAQVEDLIKAAQHQTARVQSSIINNTTPSTGTPLGMEADSKPKEQSIYPTDVMPGVHVENPTFNQVAVLDVNKTVDQAPPNPESARNAHENAVGTYMEMDQAIKAEFIAELKEVDRGVGDAMEQMMGAPAGSSMAWDTLSAANPFADLGEILSAVMKNPSNDRVLAALDQTLSNLQSSTDQKNEMAAKGKGPAPKVDWNKFETPKQLMEFMTRDVTKDPFMQQAADNEQIVERMEQNFEDYNDVYLKGEQNVTVDMMVSARNNTALLQTLARGDDEVVQQVKKGEPAKAKPPVVETADEAKLFVAAGRDISGIKLKLNDITDISEGTRETAKAAYMPPKPLNVFDGPTLAGGLA